MTSLLQRPIIILDFGSQYTELIGRRVREMGVYCEIHPFHVETEVLQSLQPSGIILSGGPSSVTDNLNLVAPSWVFESGLPVLGICYGMQTMAAQLGGKVVSSTVGEFGYAKGAVLGDSRLLSGFSSLDVWMSHGDKVTVLPEGFDVIFSTDNTAIAGMAHESKGWYGLQFHPEVTHTVEGFQLLKRFVLDICKASPNWTSQHIVESTIHQLQQTVGGDGVLLGLSGGVDSSVAAALLHRALGKQLVCVFVDTGLLRLNEASAVLELFGQHLGIQIRVVDAQKKFFAALKGVSCPEKKRKIIGRTFVEVFEAEARSIPNIKWLAQGTIYSDVIESSVHYGAIHAIKSHHNVGGLPEKMALQLLEPLRQLFKDEVRQLGAQLGLSKDILYRHPFPGPGLGVRILGEVKQKYADILRHADAIFLEELEFAGLYQQVSQAFAVFLPVRSVGVMGDGRRYDYVICLRAVETTDFMTAHWARLPWDFLANVSLRIVNEVKGVSRVTYDISGKPPATIEWE